MPTGIYPRDKSLPNLFQKGFTPWNKGKAHLRGKSHPMYGKHPVAWNKGKKTGQIPWNKKPERVVICPNCGEETIRNYSDTRKFCNRKCYWSKKKPFIRRKRGFNKECMVCQKVFYITPSSKQKYCSFKCKCQGIRKFDNNKSARRFYSVQYKARKRGADGIFTNKEWDRLKQMFANFCVCCIELKKDKDLTVDHIKPLSKEGTNYIENIQPLCRSCNSRKGVKEVKFIAMERSRRETYFST